MINEEMLLIDGMDDAYVGRLYRSGQPVIAVYDKMKCIKILVERDGMTRDEAFEFFEFNIEGAWMGDNTPGVLVLEGME